MLEMNNDYELDMCNIYLEDGEVRSTKERHATVYDFRCENISFSLNLNPKGRQIKGEVSCQVTYLPYTIEDAQKRLFYLTLLKMLSLRLGAPFVIQNERYILFKKSFELEGPADMAKVMYNVYDIVLTYLPYIKIFK